MYNSSGAGWTDEEKRFSSQDENDLSAPTNLCNSI